MRAILLPSLLLAACATDVPRSAPPTDPWEPYFGPNDDFEEQGRFLVGNLVDKLASGGSHYWVTDVGVTATETVMVSVEDDRLTAEHGDGSAFTDADFEGMQFMAGARQLRIIGVDTDPATGMLGYVLEYFDGSWKPYCDSTINKYAVPMKGAWSTGREHIDGHVLTFGCLQSGVIAKCVEWGYSPGSGGPTDPVWQQHDTCAQLAAADYCRFGIPRTRELTPIVIRDFVTDVKPHPADKPTLPLLDPTVTWPPPDDFYVEAAWQYNGPAICLTKLRWASLTTGGFCPTELPDPRDPEAPYGAAFCDDLTFTQLENRDALLYSASQVMDILAYPWRNANGEMLTSVDGYVEGTVAHSRPFPDKENYSLASPTPSFILLRNLPGSVALSEVTPLYKQHNPSTGDRVVAPLDPVTGKGVTQDHDVDTTSRAEGYMFNQFRTGLVRLRLFKKGNDYVTALANPGGGFAFDRNLGWVMTP